MASSSAPDDKCRPSLREQLHPLIGLLGRSPVRAPAPTLDPILGRDSFLVVATLLQNRIYLRQLPVPEGVATNVDLVGIRNSEEVFDADFCLHFVI